MKHRNLIRIAASALCFIAGLFFDGPVKLAFMALAWLIAGYSVAWDALTGLFRGELLDENFLMTVASVGAFVLGDFTEAAAVMLFFRIGEEFEEYAVNRSRRSIASLMDLRPDTAVLLKDGEETEVDPEDVQAGDILLVRPGERIAVDGTILTGEADLDTSRITGESQPRSVRSGDNVLSGCVNLSGVLTIEAAGTYEHSTVGRILELVESASEKKAKTERMITKFARIYTPVVVISAVLLAVLPPLLLQQSFMEWVRRALTFLVISCPCALVISVPLSFFGGMGAASKAGIVVKGGLVLEQLSRLRRVVFDKTGTLTKASFSVVNVVSEHMDKAELLRLTAQAEQHSSHPAAKAVCAAVSVTGAADHIEELPGLGVSAQVDGRTIHAGNARLMERIGLSAPVAADGCTCIHVAVDGGYAGRIELKDTLRDEAQSVISALRQNGMETVMLTGDLPAAAKEAAEALCLDHWRAGLLPQDKVSCLEELLQDGKPTAFVGDGVNDAPVLAMADVGIAMGGVGSDAAVEAADLVILHDRLTGIPAILHIARKTMTIAVQNIVFALGVKFLVLILGALGYANLWLAVFADVGVSVLAILNAMRALYLKPLAEKREP